MNSIAEIMDGFAAALELERDLGIWVVECDRTLLAAQAPRSAAPATVGRPAAPKPRSATKASPAPVPPQPQPLPPIAQPVAPPLAPRKPVAPNPAAPGEYDFVFLHDGPLSPRGAEIISKSLEKLGKAPESAPLITDGPIPKTKIAIVMGIKALKKWFPGVNAGPGQWLHMDSGGEAAVTFSPEKIVRFKEMTPALNDMKRGLWNTFKSAMQRTRR